MMYNRFLVLLYLSQVLFQLINVLNFMVQMLILAVLLFYFFLQIFYLQFLLLQYLNVLLLPIFVLVDFDF